MPLSRRTWRPRPHSQRPLRWPPTFRPLPTMRAWPRPAASLLKLARELARYMLEAAQVVAVVVERDLEVAVDADLPVAVMEADPCALRIGEAPHVVQQPRSRRDPLLEGGLQLRA